MYFSVKPAFNMNYESPILIIFYTYIHLWCSFFSGFFSQSYANSCFFQERDGLGQNMMSCGIAELFQQIWRLHSSENFADKATDPLYLNMSNIMVVMWNMTDKCTALCEHALNIGVHKDALKYMNAINPQETNNLRYMQSCRIIINV